MNVPQKKNEERRTHLALPVLEFADVKLVFVFDEPGLPKQLPQLLCPAFRVRIEQAERLSHGGQWLRGGGGGGGGAKCTEREEVGGGAVPSHVHALVDLVGVLARQEPQLRHVVLAIVAEEDRAPGLQHPMQLGQHVHHLLCEAHSS